MNSSKTVKAVLFREVGGPEVLKIENVNIAVPEPHEVRLQVKAIGLNRVDTMFRMGYFSEQPVFPSKIGFEASGIIESVGSDVKDFKAGDKVNVLPAFSNHNYGTYGELILVPAYAIQKFPETLSFEEAASLWTSFIAAYGMLVDSADIKKGQAVVINAASSNTGLAGIQITNMMGGVSIALTTSLAKREALIKAGAQHVIVTTEQDFTKEILSITGGKGAEIILDAVGGGQFDKLISAAAERAYYFAYGVLSMAPTSYPALDILLKMITVKGYNVSDLLMDYVKSKAAIQFVKEGVQSGKLKPVVAKSFSLEDVVESHRYLESNQHFGKVVLSL